MVGIFYDGTFPDSRKSKFFLDVVFIQCIVENTLIIKFRDNYRTVNKVVGCCLQFFDFFRCSAKLIKQDVDRCGRKTVLVQDLDPFMFCGEDREPPFIVPNEFTTSYICQHHGI